MGLFRRKQETLNEQLLREAGLDDSTRVLRDLPQEPEPQRESEPAPEPPPGPEFAEPAPFPVVDIQLGHRQSRGRVRGEWDTMLTVRSASLAGARIEFTTLPNGDIMVETEEGDEDLAPLAEAVERHVDPPYRAIATRQDEDVWAVGAKRIQVARFEFAEGDAIELIVNDGAVEVRVDGEPSDAQVPELEQLGARDGANYCVEAGRIDGDYWEVEATAL